MPLLPIYFQIMLGFKSIFAKMKPVQETLSFASVWKSFSRKEEGANSSSVLDTPKTSGVESSSSLASVASSLESSSVLPVPTFENVSVDSVSNRRSKASKMKLSKEDQGKIQTYLEGAVKLSSRKTYTSYWRRFEAFCAKKKFKLNSAEAISLFLIELAESTNSKASLSAKTAIKYFLKVTNYYEKSSSDSYLVGRVAKSISKKYGKPVKKAKTLSSKEIRDMVELLLRMGGFKNERTAIFFLLQFLLMARFEEVANLRKENVVVLDSGDMEVKIVEAKNYGSWDSQKSYIAKGKSDFDPVSLIQTYIAKLDGSTWLFPNFRISKNQSISLLQTRVSYNNMLALLRSSLEMLGLDGKLYSLHSPRTGALSEAANAKDLDKDDLQRHGRWKSAGMVNYYHQLSLEKKLSSSKALKLYN